MDDVEIRRARRNSEHVTGLQARWGTDMIDESDPFADIKLRQEQLLQQLKGAPLVGVRGVVAAGGVSRGKFQGQKFWTITFTFERWRVQHDAVQTRPLTVCRTGPDSELKALTDAIVPYAVIRINARVVTESSFAGPQALLEAMHGLDPSDADLNLAAEQLQKPVTCDDPVFGTLTLDRQIDCFRGDAVWNGQPIALTLSVGERNDIEEALEVAHALWLCQNKWDQRIRDFALTELLPLKNENWLDEGEAEVTREQFEKRMSLESVSVYPDGSFEFDHNDGDLFWGHSIQVSGSLSEGPNHAAIPG
jgi:hypothetical protein